MKLHDWFPNEEEALERGNRVLDAIRDGLLDVLQREFGKTVIVEGRATGLTQRGIGHDFTFNDIYIRVYGSPLVSLETMRSCVSCYLIVRGMIIGTYNSHRVLVLSVKPNDYQITGTA